MELEHSFTVPVPMDRAWDVLLDVERVASCMPGATLDSVDGDEIRGRIKVKVGPISMMYAGTARFVERDRAAGVVTLEASGKETKGAGTASASVRSVLTDGGPETHVTVHTTLNVTGKPAQFGRGVMSEVSGKLLGIFAENLAATLGEQDAPEQGGGPAGPPAEAAPADAGAAAAAADAAPPASSQHEGALSASIDELGLPARAISTLHREGIVTLGDLVARTDDQLLAIDGIGPASLVEIKARLADRNLHLSQAAAESAAPPEPVAPSANGAARPGAAAPKAPAQPTAAPKREADSINLIKVAGLPVLKRAVPVLAGLTAVLLIGLRRRLRRRHK
jgi:carbon monoxide dehydrogenase subunit G